MNKIAMANAKYDHSNIIAKQNEGIFLEKSNRNNDGGCNGCIITKENYNYPITIIHMRGISVRLCDDCKNKLKNLL